MCFTFFFGSIAISALASLSAVTCGLVACGPGVKKAKKSQSDMEYWLREEKQEGTSQHHDHSRSKTPNPTRRSGHHRPRTTRESTEVPRGHHHHHHHHSSAKSGALTSPGASVNGDRSHHNHHHLDAYRTSHPSTPTSGSGRASPQSKGPAAVPQPQSLPLPIREGSTTVPDTPTLVMSGSEKSPHSDSEETAAQKDIVSSSDETRVHESKGQKEKSKLEKSGVGELSSGSSTPKHG